MFYLATITKWESHRDSKGRVSAIDRPDGRSFLINTDRITDLRVGNGNTSRFRFTENVNDPREAWDYVEASDSVDELKTGHDIPYQSLFVTLPIHQKNNINRATVDTTIEVSDFVYADAYNAAPDDASWVVYIKEGFKRVEVLVSLTLAEIFALVEGVAAPVITGTSEGDEGGILIEWTDKSSNEDGFEIWVSEDGGAYVLLDTVGAGTTSYEDTTSPGEEMTYKIRSYKGSVYSDFSNEVSASSSWTQRYPSALFGIMLSETSVYLSHTNNGTQDYDSIVYEASTDEGVNFTEISTGITGATTKTITDLAADTSYVFRMRYKKGGSYSAYSNQTKVITTSYLVAGYTLNSDANDYSGNGHNGTVAVASSVAAKYGNGYDFPGSANQKISIPDNDAFTFLNAGNGLTWVNSAGNPTTSGSSESDFIMDDDGVTCHQWYKPASALDGRLYHRTANNALLDNWGVSALCDVEGFFPSVFKIGTTFYLFIKQAAWDDGDIYLYQSTNKVNWTVMNGGDPVIVHSANEAAWNNVLYNVGVCVVGTTVHILCDGSIKRANINWSNPYHVGYASADISNPVFTLPATATLENSMNAGLIYSEKRNTIVALYNVWRADGSSPASYMRMMKVNLANNPALTGSWERSALSFESLVTLAAAPYPSDFSICETPGKTYPLMIYYNYNQLTGHQAYANVDLEGLIDSITQFGYSVCFWIKADAVGTVYLVSKDLVTGNLREWAIYLASNLLIFDLMNNNATKSLRVSMPFTTTGTWVFVCCTYDGSPSVYNEGSKIYINGVESQTVRANTGTFVTTQNLTHPVYIGSYNAANYYFNGIIDEVKIFNKALNVKEQEFIMANTKLW